MKFRPTDRMLQLGVVPALTNHIKRAYPEASASLWQRDAKAAHRRILEPMPDVPGDGPFARQLHGFVSLAALLLAFHESAPDGTKVDDAGFGTLVDLALVTPIVRMTFAAPSPFSEEGIRELEQIVEAQRSSAHPAAWSAALALSGDSGSNDQSLVFSVARCGLLAMCVREKRFYLLGQLCRIEGALAASGGVRLVCDDCLARGDQRCTIRCAKA